MRSMRKKEGTKNTRQAEWGVLLGMRIIMVAGKDVVWGMRMMQRTSSRSTSIIVWIDLDSKNDAEFENDWQDAEYYSAEQEFEEAHEAEEYESFWEHCWVWQLTKLIEIENNAPHTCCCCLRWQGGDCEADRGCRAPAAASRIDLS